MRPVKTRSIALTCALAAFLAAAIPTIASLKVLDGRVSGMVRMAESEPIAPYARAGDGGFRFVDIGAHYDGVYFYAIARDPFAQGEAHQLIDKSAYRYGHAGYGWMAGILSLGRASAVPLALLLLALAGMAAAGGGMSLLFAHHGLTPWGGLFVAFNPGLIYAVTTLTSEAVGAGVCAWALLMWARKRYALATVLLIVLCLIKEPFVMVPVGIALWEGIQWLRGGRVTPPTDVLKRWVLLAIGPLIFIAWYVYLRATFGHWSFEETEGFFAFPFTGWFESMEIASQMATADFNTAQLGAAAAPLIAATMAIILVGLVVSARLSELVDAPYLFLGLIAAALQPIGVLYPKDLIREVALPLLLVPLVLAVAARARSSSDTGATTAST